MQGSKEEVGQFPPVTDSGCGEQEAVVLKSSQGCHPEAPEGTPGPLRLWMPLNSVIGPTTFFLLSLLP